MILLAVLAACATGAAGEACAAVRLCEASVSSGLKTAATEQEARRRAMAAWVAAAGRHGAGYTSWRLAVGKHFSCARTSDGKAQCLAKAEPCTIAQKPPSPGLVPERKTPGIDG